MIEKRLEEAEQRKVSMQEEKRLSKMKKNYEFFEKCMELGGKNYYKNIEIFEKYNQIRDVGIQVRSTVYVRFSIMKSH